MPGVFFPNDTVQMKGLKIYNMFCNHGLYSLRLKEEQSAIPEESANKEGEGINDDKNLAAPGDIFTAKKRLGKQGCK